MTYRSPVADILFSLKAVAGLPELIGERLDGEFDWDTIASVVSEAGRFATEEIAPLNRTGDTVGAQYENGVVTTPPGFAAAYRRWAEAGWGGVWRRPSLAAWDCRTSSTSPAPKSGTAPRWPSPFARC